jgi:hypothetical protein
VFEMAEPFESLAKYEFRSVIGFLKAKVERPAEIHKKQVVSVYGNVMNRQNVTKCCRELCERRTDVHDEQMSGRTSLIKRQAANFGDSGIHKLVPRLKRCLNNAGDYVEK